MLEAPGTEDRPLRLSVNVGAFSEPVRIGPGKYSATYLPPPERYTQVALVAVWKETGPDASITVVTPFQEFGPVTIDANGKANVAIERAAGDYRVGLASPAVDSALDLGLFLLPQYPATAPRFLGAGPDRGGRETW